MIVDPQCWNIMAGISDFIGTVVPEESADRELRGQAPVYTFTYTLIERGIALCAD
jgi:hypothetical protein